MTRFFETIIAGAFIAIAALPKPIGALAEFIHRRDPPLEHCPFCGCPFTETDREDIAGMCDRCNLEESMA